MTAANLPGDDAAEIIVMPSGDFGRLIVDAYLSTPPGANVEIHQGWLCFDDLRLPVVRVVMEESSFDMTPDGARAAATYVGGEAAARRAAPFNRADLRQIAAWLREAAAEADGGGSA